ncbi:MAG: hypothetical protein AAF184_09800 [Pseudomonadota bacterium]
MENETPEDELERRRLFELVEKALYRRFSVHAAIVGVFAGAVFTLAGTLGGYLIKDSVRDALLHIEAATLVSEQTLERLERAEQELFAMQGQADRARADLERSQNAWENLRYQADNTVQALSYASDLGDALKPFAEEIGAFAARSGERELEEAARGVMQALGESSDQIERALELNENSKYQVGIVTVGMSRARHDQLIIDVRAWGYSLRGDQWLAVPATHTRASRVYYYNSVDLTAAVKLTERLQRQGFNMENPSIGGGLGLEAHEWGGGTLIVHVISP